jgi:hypothetical protein
MVVMKCTKRHLNDSTAHFTPQRGGKVYALQRDGLD